MSFYWEQEQSRLEMERVQDRQERAERHRPGLGIDLRVWGTFWRHCRHCRRPQLWFLRCQTDMRAYGFCAHCKRPFLRSRFLRGYFYERGVEF